jgi:hypothetical protein
MKKIMCFFLITSLAAVAQTKLITKTGKIVFEASVPAFEEVKAKHENVTCVFKPKTGEIASLALIRGFRFKVALMEEHFNENYAESDQFKKSTFKGKLENFDEKAVTNENKEFVLNGELEFHGKTNPVKTMAKVKKADGGYQILVDFSVLASDFDVKIPNLVKNKLTNKVNVKCEFLVK